MRSIGASAARGAGAPPVIRASSAAHAAARSGACGVAASAAACTLASSAGSPRAVLSPRSTRSTCAACTAKAARAGSLHWAISEGSSDPAASAAIMSAAAPSRPVPCGICPAAARRPCSKWSACVRTRAAGSARRCNASGAHTGAAATVAAGARASSLMGDGDKKEGRETVYGT